MSIYTQRTLTFQYYHIQSMSQNLLMLHSQTGGYGSGQHVLLKVSNIFTGHCVNYHFNIYIYNSTELYTYIIVQSFFIEIKNFVKIESYMSIYIAHPDISVLTHSIYLSEFAGAAQLDGRIWEWITQWTTDFSFISKTY